MEPRVKSRVNVLRWGMHLLGYGAESRKPSQCIKVGNACIKIGDACIKIGDACNEIGNSVR